ncbi:hypothetical protein RchiOBHm_Chr6g0265281 [Rosa chinensis]|uniref:Uncharacterized protein n=1 Tax=Rosa chinensis TaxID=74649 RepID=A0A2P6PPC9_ROSCH|nr:hypothetical protein RchiOBHm_Chr6g0265281 [Rosa chinensis]
MRNLSFLDQDFCSTELASSLSSSRLITMHDLSSLSSSPASRLITLITLLSNLVELSPSFRKKSASSFMSKP